MFLLCPLKKRVFRAYFWKPWPPVYPLRLLMSGGGGKLFHLSFYYMLCLLAILTRLSSKSKKFWDYHRKPAPKLVNLRKNGRRSMILKKSRVFFLLLYEKRFNFWRHRSRRVISRGVFVEEGL